MINLLHIFNRLYSIWCSKQIRSSGRNFYSAYPLTIEGGSSIKIGHSFTAMGYDFLYANDGGSLIIGNNCSINTNVQLGAAFGRIVIGNNVLIGPNVVIRASNHGTARESYMRFQPHTYGEIYIEDDVWIGSNAVITSGVNLAVGTVVGAGAVVTKSTEPYSIVAGVPARKIGERV
jgi:galactoside O-acetyltransferase